MNKIDKKKTKTKRIVEMFNTRRVNQKQLVDQHFILTIDQHLKNETQ